MGRQRIERPYRSSFIDREKLLQCLFQTSYLLSSRVRIRLAGLGVGGFRGSGTLEALLSHQPNLSVAVPHQAAWGPRFLARYKTPLMDVGELPRTFLEDLHLLVNCHFEIHTTRCPNRKKPAAT